MTSRYRTLAAAYSLLQRSSGRDWKTSHRPGETDPPPGPVDVILPIAGAAEEVLACLASLAEHTDLAVHRLVAVLDGLADPRVERSLDALSARRDFDILTLRSPEPRGFVASVNRGMESSQRDVVLLNSDTLVTASWLAKLQRAAYSAPEVATATPFSNHATICSLPRFLAENALPTGYDVDSFGRLVERVSRRDYPLLPTGVGVCLYIKRKVVEQLGPFDQTLFGLGYGEESEFCFRALVAGYVHVLDDATFIFHAGHRSFGRSRHKRVAAAHRALRRRHPDYLPTIARFVAEDPLAPVRERVVSALRLPRADGLPDASPRRVVHVVHGWPPWSRGGTELYARWLAVRQAEVRGVAVYARRADADRDLGDALELLDGGIRVRLRVNNFEQRDPQSRNALADRSLERDFAGFLDQERPDLVHLHHLSGHALSLAGILSRRRLPFVLHLHDWWLLCARANLWRPDGSLCSGPTVAKCSRCLALTGLPGAALWNPLLYARRRRLARRAVSAAAAVVVGSEPALESFRRLGLLDAHDPRLHLVPYGVDLADRAEPRRTASAPRPAGPLRIGYVGALLPHKGVDVLVRAFCRLEPGLASLEIWGSGEAAPASAAELRSAVGSGVAFRGPFPEDMKKEVLSELDLLVVPSVGLESFGLVAREAMACGTPVAVSRRGALAALADELGPWSGFAPGDPADLARALTALARKRDPLDGFRARPPAVRGMNDNARDIERVYQRVTSRPVP